MVWVPAVSPGASGEVPAPTAAVKTGCGAPSTTASKRYGSVEGVSVRPTESPVPESCAMKPVPDQEKRGPAALAVSTRPNQRTPAATTPAGGTAAPASVPPPSPEAPPTPIILEPPEEQPTVTNTPRPMNPSPMTVARSISASTQLTVSWKATQ